MTLVYKRFNEDLLYIKNGYLTNAEKPHDTEYFNNGYWCEEANLIMKINYNNDGYFDFSKSQMVLHHFFLLLSDLQRK